MNGYGRAWLALLAVLAGLALLGALAEPSRVQGTGAGGIGGDQPSGAHQVKLPPDPDDATAALLRLQLAKERRAWAVRADRYQREIRRLRAEVRRLRDQLNPTPAGNQRLAAELFGDAYPCAAEIIDGETGGTWRHDVAYGFRYGEALISSGLAYGLGQARPGTKMLAYGADAASNPLTQLRWFRAYAAERYGSVCGAAAHWTPGGSW